MLCGAGGCTAETTGAGICAAGWATGLLGTRALASATSAGVEALSTADRTLPATDIASVTAPTTTIAAATFTMGIRTLGSPLWCGEASTSSLPIESNRAACVFASASFTGAWWSAENSSGSWE